MNMSRMNLASASEVRNNIIDQLRVGGCVFAEDEATLLISEARTMTSLQSMVRKRVAGLPLEHIVGWAEFCGQRVIVGPGVFVPRRRSELIVREAVGCARSGSIVVDLGCGSGALGLAVHAAVTGLQLYATDIDPVAVTYARSNVTPLGGHVYEGDLYENLPPSLKGCIDILLVNAPYVPSASIEYLPAEARLHEPLVTLDGGIDGHDIQRRVVADASVWLGPNGTLLMETSELQSVETAAIMTRHGFSTHVARDNELDATVVIATKN